MKLHREHALELAASTRSTPGKLFILLEHKAPSNPVQSSRCQTLFCLTVLGEAGVVKHAFVEELAAEQRAVYTSVEV